MKSPVNKNTSQAWHHKIVMVCAAAALCSCSTTPKKSFQTLTYTLPQNCVIADEIPMESTIGVRGPDTVKAYPVGRYVDPVNKQVMHERTVIYRVESPAHWKLRTPPDRVQLGPAAGARLPNQVDGPIASELKSELAWQKAVTSKVLQMAQNLQGMENINSTAQRIVANQQLVLQTVQGNQAEVKKLQERIEAVAKKQEGEVSKDEENAAKPVKSGTNTPASASITDTATAGFKVPESNFLLTR